VAMNERRGWENIERMNVRITKWVRRKIVIVKSEERRVESRENINQRFNHAYGDDDSVCGFNGENSVVNRLHATSAKSRWDLSTS
jgi:hypothetical protein